MEFEFTSEQVQLRKQVREFAQAEIAPHVRRWDEHSEFPAEVVKKLGQLGYLGVIFPEELGGAGLGYIEYAIVLEELARVDGSVGLIVAAHTSLCSNHINIAGSDEQRRKYLPELASGRKLGCWSLTEPDTVNREQQAMRLGRARRAEAKGFLLYHEFTPALAATLPEAQAAWRWLLGQREENPNHENRNPPRPKRSGAAHRT